MEDVSEKGAWSLEKLALVLNSGSSMIIPQMSLIGHRQQLPARCPFLVCLLPFISFSRNRTLFSAGSCHQIIDQS